MSDHEDSKAESLMEKISEKIHGHYLELLDTETHPSDKEPLPPPHPTLHLTLPSMFAYYQYLELSPAAFLGLSSPKPLRMRGYIAGRPVTVLIDSGSTHNIVQPRVATFLQLPVEAIASFSVMVGNGSLIHCTGRCPDVSLRLADADFSLSFFVLPIEGAEVVLGMDWLSSLGQIIADFSIPQLTFHHGASEVVLQGEPLVAPATTGEISQLLRKDAVASMYAMVFDPHPFSPQLPESAANNPAQIFNFSWADMHTSSKPQQNCLPNDLMTEKVLSKIPRSMKEIKKECNLARCVLYV